MRPKNNLLAKPASYPKRVEEIDILKAFAIFFVVAAHAGAPFSKFVYLFHVAVFFIASGFFYKESYASNLSSVSKFSLKKLKDLWMPYFVWTAIFILLNNVFIHIQVYTDNPDILLYVQGPFIGTHEYMTGLDMLKEIVGAAFFIYDTQIGGALWFLKILCPIAIAYCIGDFIVKSILRKHVLTVQLTASILFLCIGCYLSCKIKSFQLVLSYYCLFYLGHLLGMYKENIENWTQKTFLGIFFISFAVLLLLNQMGSIDLAANHYKNPAFLLITSFCGWWWLYSVSILICKSSGVIPWLKQMLLFVGRRTLPILIFHFLAFKIVNVIVCKVYGLPLFCVAAFPRLYGEKAAWWLVFTLVGVIVPIMLYEIYKMALTSCFKNRTNPKNIKPL